MVARLAIALVLVVPLVTPALARADAPPPPENEACGGKKGGEACTVAGRSGTCVPDTCVRLDYSKGSPPETVQRACFRCQEAPAPAVAQPEAKRGCRLGGESGGPPLALVLVLAAIRRRARGRRGSGASR